MKVYLLRECDFERLLAEIDRDPLHGFSGGSTQSQVRDPANDKAFAEAHAFYNYQVRKWIERVQDSRE